MNVLHNLHTIDVEPGELGVTVRLGDKWQFLAPVESQIRLCECSDRCLTGADCGADWSADNKATQSCFNCKVVGAGMVIDQWFGPFKDVPARFLEHEHEIRSRYYTGLFASMTKAYGGWTNFNEKSLVTVLTYERTA